MSLSFPYLEGYNVYQQAEVQRAQGLGDPAQQAFAGVWGIPTFSLFGSGWGGEKT
jgi:hypothetical protein